MNQTTTFQAGTHCVDLTEATIQANKRFFASEEDVPRKAYFYGNRQYYERKDHSSCS